MIYLDDAATSPLLPVAREAMLDAYDAPLGNASSLHSAGTMARNIVETARADIARLIGADPSEIIFTSGGTESNNTIMHIFSGKHIAISPYEHPSIIESAKIYGKSLSYYDPLDPDSVVPDGTNLLSIMLGNNETGHLFTLPEKSQRHHAYLHSDLTAALGKIPIDVHALGLDYATLTSHKIGGPQGIGAIYVKNPIGNNLRASKSGKTPFTPLLYGGHQESGRRAGTYAVPLIVGFGAAARYHLEHRTWDIYKKQVRPLRDLLASRVKKEIPRSLINTPLEHSKSLPHILNVSFPGAEGESTQLLLDLEQGIIVSTGSACASGEPSHVLMSLTRDPERAHSSIRFTLSESTTEADIDAIMSTLPSIIKKLRGISTL